jgi:micrococcal nuclease
MNEGLNGKVISVIDGNTVEVLTPDNIRYKLLLYGIDSPELKQEYGDKAKKYLEKLALEKKVTVQVVGKDRWGNRMAVVLMEDGTDPRIELLKEGLAWTSEHEPLADLEPYRSWAKSKGKGLWKEGDPTPPWVFRRTQTMLEAKAQ